MTEMTPLEKMARAAFDREPLHDGEGRPFPEEFRERNWRQLKHIYMDDQRAALKAMREPDPEMIERACIQEVDAFDARVAWHAMINNILERG